MSMDLVAGKDSGATGRNKDHRETQTSLGVGEAGRWMWCVWVVATSVRYLTQFLLCSSFLLSTFVYILSSRWPGVL